MSKSAGELLSLVRAYLGRLDDVRVSQWLAEAGPLPSRSVAAHPLPCLRHLQRATEIAPEAARPLTQLLADQASALQWGQTYSEADFDRAFLENYGWLEVFGTRGHFVSEHVACGFLVLGPRTLYPDHHHLAEEIYVPLTGGTDWRKGGGSFQQRQAGEIVHHLPNINHSMRTGAEPLLALYLWRGGLLDAKSTLTGSGAKS